ncbi:MAG: hypothetical protein ACFFD1_12175, partial [Candidatus Thorarchaeota archaeon]
YDQRYFQEVYRNNEFIIFKKIFTVPFYYGPYDVKITTINKKISLIGDFFENYFFSDNNNITFDWDLSMLKTTTVKISQLINITLLSTGSEELLNSTYNISNSDTYPFLKTEMKLPVTSFKINKIILELTFSDLNNNDFIKIYEYSPKTTLNFNYSNGHFLLPEKQGLFIKEVH